MGEIDKKQIAKIVGLEEETTTLTKKVRIIKDKRQFSIRIPKKFAEQMNINEKIDTMEFELIPYEGRFELKARLIQNE